MPPRNQPDCAVNGTRSRSAKLHPRGFTLVELMAVIVIIGLLAGLVIMVAGYINKKSAISRATAEMAALSLAIDNYKFDVGVYPASSTARVSGVYGSLYITNNSLLYSQLSINPSYLPKNLRLTNSYPAWIACYCAYGNTGVTVNATFILDPWNRPYNYFCAKAATNQYNTASFDLWSYGPNGLNDNGTNDDICNWRK